MSQKDKLKKSVAEALRQQEPLMDIDKFKAELVDWLSQMELPKDSPVSSWEECLKVFESSSEEASRNEGLKLRISLRLYTLANRYLISLMESLDPDSRGVYILAVHVNWKDNERGLQQIVEQAYKGDFNDVLCSSHVVWIQTLLENELKSAMDSAALAILSHELKGTNTDRRPGESLRRPAADKIEFPTDTEKEVDLDTID